MAQHVDEKDYYEAKLLAHVIKTEAYQLGASHIYYICETME